MGSANGGRISNTGPCSSARSAKSAGTLPSRICWIEQQLTQWHGRNFLGQSGMSKQRAGEVVGDRFGDGPAYQIHLHEQVHGVSAKACRSAGRGHLEPQTVPIAPATLPFRRQDYALSVLLCPVLSRSARFRKPHDLKLAVGCVRLRFRKEPTRHSALRPPESRAVHDAPVIVERPLCCGIVEGNGAAVILRHVGRNRISANPFMSLEQAEVKAVGVMMQGPCGAQS